METIQLHRSQTSSEYWDNNKEDIVDLYINKNQTTEEIAKKYNCVGSTIGNHLKEWGISKQRPNSIYNLDVNYFDEITTEDRAYFMGLLLADGHISKLNSIMLTMKDFDIIKKYQKALKTNMPIKTDKYNNYYLNIVCEHMADSLRIKGFHNRKSYYIDFDTVISFIPQSLFHHFIRGMFDGDGSIKIYKYDYVKNPQYHFGYTGLKKRC